MKYYWLHFKEDKERGMREAWYLALSWSSSPSSGWLYQQGRKEWLFCIYDIDKQINIQFKDLTKREAMRRCVAILKLFNEMENGKGKK